MTDHDSKTASLSFNAGQTYSDPAFSYEEYVAYLDELDLNDERKAELLRVLWNIIGDFVALGLGLHPAQLVQASCGQSEMPASETGVVPLEWTDGPLIKKFASASDHPVEAERTRDENKK